LRSTPVPCYPEGMRSRPRTSCASLAALLVIACSSGRPAAAQDASAPQGEEPPTSTTEVLGTIPVDLRGLWLLVANGKAGESQLVRNTVELYSIAQKDGALDVELLVRDLPKKLQDDIASADKASRPWTPTEADLGLLRSEVDALEAGDPMRYVKHATRLVAPDRYAADLHAPNQSMVENSAFAIEIEHDYRPRPVEGRTAQLIADKAVYAVRESEPPRLEGEHLRTILAAGFVPVPINFSGPFTLYRLRDASEWAPPPQSFTARLAAWTETLFRGCR
jgi:hypothetical protein